MSSWDALQVAEQRVERRGVGREGGTGLSTEIGADCSRLHCSHSIYTERRDVGFNLIDFSRFGFKLRR